PRNSERSFCCGAGGARMWMEETIGERINLNRTNEAVETGADQIATGCPFCRVMLSDGLTAKQADGSAREEVEVLDVAQLLLASVKGESRTPAAAGVSAKAEPSKGDVTQTPSTVTATKAVGANAAATEEKDPEVETSKPLNKGSLFEATPDEPVETKSTGTGMSLFDTPAESAPAPGTPAAPEAESVAAEKSETNQDSALGSGSLFDTPAESAPAEAAEPKAPAEPSIGTGGSLFDVAPSEPEPARPEPVKAEEPKAAEPKAEAAPTPEAPAGESKIESAGSLFDLSPSEPEPAKAEQPEAEQPEAEQPEAEEAPAEATPNAPESSGEKHEPKKPEGGIDESKSLFDI
ncbi:MAG TPA: heterodisulfide reductase-related iron-sulfur binding cluster, partial [Nocardioidaceae bacterium]|nr:heterodisulfide reductase-related iron-sulfur binding cluster [Nocardioidaceae bacterium]